MRANILLIEFEQRSVDRVRQALAETEHQLEIAGDLDRAVEICAHFEPRLVIITADLPKVSVEDAITQLRARAGLRVTPFLILKTGYDGTASEADAAELGAHDILGSPFVSQALIERSSAWCASTPASPRLRRSRRRPWMPSARAARPVVHR